MIVCYRFRWRRSIVGAAVAVSSLLASACPAGAEPSAPTTADDGFAARHPRLLFSTFELPLWQARVSDGGVDDAAYAFIRSRCVDVYTSAEWDSPPFDSLIANDVALEPMLNLALVSHFEASVDSELVSLGRRLTLHVARTWGVDTDPYTSSLRLRALSFGFDHFFVNATPSERDEIRAEAQSYISYMTTHINYDIWRHRPYVSNKTAMIAASLGLAGISFQDELPAAVTAQALAKADEYFQVWRDTHLGNDGCYREGSLYIGWSMRHLIYYFAARKRFDGFDYAQDPVIQSIERWMPYEVDPRGDARVNNIQDQTDYYRPLARHTTLWAWAQSEWHSPIAAYMWEHSTGPFGRDLLDENDKAATVLWHTGVTPVNPAAVLRKSHVWEDRGLYYFRTGWPDGASSDDVVFSFYSGVFRGGHAQEDQNQFTLAAYGEKLVFDQGAGAIAKQTEAHNIIRIDGLGQHNAGSSIGTDGRIAGHVVSDFADYVRGDATLAYTTHSPYNNTGVPYPWSDWNWGLTGANPVEHATRTVVSVHGEDAPPYFVIRDDIQKDANPHQYDWCLHVASTSAVNAQADPVSITSGGATLQVYPVYPSRDDLITSVTPFDNANADPNSRMLTIRTNAVDPHFTMLLLPLPASAAPPQFARTLTPGGGRVTLEWESGVIDEIVMRLPASPEAESVTDPFPWAVETDACLAVVRKSGPQVTGYTLVDGTHLSVGGVLMAAFDDGPGSLVFDGTRVHLDREDARFRLQAASVSGVYFRGIPVPSHRDGEFLVSGYPSGVPSFADGDLQLRAYPNPFNPSVQIAFVNPERGPVHAVIYDAGGRRVKVLSSRTLPAGPLTMHWDGQDDRGKGVASGVYFLRVRAGSASATQKLVLLR